MSSTGAGVIQSDTDVHISRENQKKINTFAIRNGWMEELSDELKSKQNDLKNLEDAEAEIMLQDDDSVAIPIFVGDTYVHFSQEKATEVVQELMEKTREDIRKLELRIEEVRDEMSKLKNELYSKFGDNINLENEDD